MGRVIHFEIGADDPDKVGNFYQEVFGWEVRKWDGPVDYWLVMTGDSEEAGIDGAIMARQSDMPPTINTIDVDSLETAMESVKSAGGQLLGEAQAVPGVGYFAYCTDVEGNVFGMMESDETAQ